MNAYQAMTGGGKLTITARTLEDFVEISVSDTGSGIAPENLNKIFEPLFTTKAKGIGLGLMISKMLVETNNGHIEFDSQVNEGTTFSMKLPVTKAKNAK